MGPREIEVFLQSDVWKEFARDVQGRAALAQTRILAQEGQETIEGYKYNLGKYQAFRYVLDWAEKKLKNIEKST